MADILEIMAKLSPQAQHELLDFAEFLQKRYVTDSWPESQDWRQMSQSALSAYWDNVEDDVYAALL
jgi:hypothetical protein